MGAHGARATHTHTSHTISLHMNTISAAFALRATAFFGHPPPLPLHTPHTDRVAAPATLTCDESDSHSRAQLAADEGDRYAHGEEAGLSE